MNTFNAIDSNNSRVTMFVGWGIDANGNVAETAEHSVLDTIREDIDLEGEIAPRSDCRRRHTQQLRVATEIRRSQAWQKAILVT